MEEEEQHPEFISGPLLADTHSAASTALWQHADIIVELEQYLKLLTDAKTKNGRMGIVDPRLGFQRMRAR